MRACDGDFDAGSGLKSKDLDVTCGSEVLFASSYTGLLRRAVRNRKLFR